MSYVSRPIKVHHAVIKVLEGRYRGKAEGYSGIHGEHGESAMSVSLPICAIFECVFDAIGNIYSYFQKSLVKNKNSPICPYGKDCFYEHVKEDGTPFIFKHGVEICMKVCIFLSQSTCT
jgi:hypothetical protein